MLGSRREKITEQFKNMYNNFEWIVTSSNFSFILKYFVCKV